MVLRPLAYRIHPALPEAIPIETLYEVKLLCKTPVATHIRTLLLSTISHLPVTLQSLRGEQDDANNQAEITAGGELVFTMQSEPNRPISPADGKPPGESSDQRKQQGRHPRASHHFVDKRFQRRDRFAIGHVLEIAVSEGQQPGGCEIAENREPGLKAAVHKTSIDL